LKTGIELIAEERQRQITVEGWTPEHDDTLVKGQLAHAATAYANVSQRGLVIDWRLWPWEYDLWKPSKDSIRNLVKAGALIAAEIDRLQRKNLNCQSHYANDHPPSNHYVHDQLRQ
jgi:hypothetical protein